jgi:putative toxin-antitoxin system antitoxin component (TIGR02293 family)
MPFRSPEELLGMPRRRHKDDSGKQILKGLPVRNLNAFQRITAATEEELIHILWMSPRILKSRMQAGRLMPSESDRLFCAMRIIARALLHFDDNEKRVQAWLRAPASKKHHVPPISLLGTFAGAELAYHYLEGAYFELYLLGKSNPKIKGKRGRFDYPDPLAILGLKRSTDIDDRIRKGFHYHSYELFRMRTLYSVKEMQQILWVSSSTLSKYRTLGRLPGDISDRLYRAAVVFYFVNEMVGYSACSAQEWIHHPAFRLGYRRPIDLLRTDPGSDEVISTACRVIDGIPA